MRRSNLLQYQKRHSSALWSQRTNLATRRPWALGNSRSTDHKIKMLPPIVRFLLPINSNYWY